MLKLLKFSVPFTSRNLNFRTITRVSCSDDKSLCKKRITPAERANARRSRCLEQKKALERCPKESFAKRCREKFSADVQKPKCNWSAADEYLRAYKTTLMRVKKVTDLVEANVGLIMQEIKTEISKNRANEKMATRKIQQTVEPKIRELASLDTFCATKKKHKFYFLNYRAQQELINGNSETELQFQFIENQLEEFKEEVTCRACCALGLISSCRKSFSPAELINCVENSSKEAAKMLDDVNNDFKKRLEDAKIMKDEMLKDDKKCTGEVMKNYEEKIDKLMIEVADCIRDRNMR